MSTKKLNPRLYRGDSTFDALDKEDAIKKANDLKKRRTQRRQSFSGTKELAAAAKEQQIKERANAPVTILAPLKRVPNPAAKTYKKGLRSKSSGKRESRSRSKSNSSPPPSEELNINNSSDAVEGPPGSINEPMIEPKNTPVSLPAILKPQQPISKGSLFVKKRPIKLPAVLRGGRKKTAKRRRSKKSCGWFW